MFIRNSIAFGKEYCLSSFSKKGETTIANYILKIIARIAKNRPLFRDEYAVLCAKLADKFCVNTIPTLNALSVYYNKPDYNLGYGRFISATRRFEILFFEIDALKLSQGDFCYINKHKGCRFCHVFMQEGFSLCDACYKLLIKHQKDEREALELRSLTRKLEKVNREKNKRTASVFNQNNAAN